MKCLCTSTKQKHQHYTEGWAQLDQNPKRLRGGRTEKDGGGDEESFVLGVIGTVSSSTAGVSWVSN